MLSLKFYWSIEGVGAHVYKMLWNIEVVLFFDSVIRRGKAP